MHLAFGENQMSVGPALETDRPEDAFCHEAIFYAGHDDFVARTSSFIREAVDAQEPILVVVSAPKIEALRGALHAAAEKVQFADMAQVGTNPARIIPAWRDFVAEHAAAGRRFRGIGEPIWAGRTPDELVECERHESLLNLAFAGVPAWWLACPYDTVSLDPSVLAEARRNHPYLSGQRGNAASDTYRGLDDVVGPFDEPLPEPDGRPDEMAFGERDLTVVRDFVARHAVDVGFDAEQTAELVLAVDECATNSLLHADGGGVLRIWQTQTALICEVRDQGRIRDPLVGRERPTPDQEGGFGLWLANQLCDLVQVRSFPTGSVVRLHLSRR
jgi:anti-sigma regulatory factor (Ser/Thr protein kinase)